MLPSEIEKLTEVKEATRVLVELEKRGLEQASIASGWLRGFLTDTKPSDIDVLYVGPVHFEAAQQHLAEVLAELSIDPTDWDIKGIWNAELAWKLPTIEESVLVYYVCSIDSVYLASDGRLHDPTGHGFSDAATKTLRLNEYQNPYLPNTPGRMVYLLMEGCRRIAKFGWSPTARSVELIKKGVKYWQEGGEEARQERLAKLAKKYPPPERERAQKIYNKYGWGFVFDEIRD